MSWKSFACVAALTALVAPASAVPSISWVDNTGSATLQVTVTDTGSIATEIDLTTTGTAAISNIVINGSVLDTANPGSNLGGGTGLVGNSFAFGSDVLTAGTYDLATLDYSGTGDVVASGLVAQLGVNTTGLSATLAVDDTPGGVFGDFEPDGDVDIIDFGVFADAFDTVAGDPDYLLAADSEPDGDVDIIDFGLFADNFIASNAAFAVPEPSSALLVILGTVAVAAARRS